MLGLTAQSISEYKLDRKKENRILKGSIIVYWFLFWFFNVVDKLIGGSTFLFVGKDRLAQFTEYFNSIGLTNPFVAKFVLFVVTVIEIIALVYLALALWNWYKKDENKTHVNLFLGLFWSFVTFSLFAIGDQIFGDRFELLEHSIYWVAVLLSWYVYTHLRK